jgi:RNA polymerase sigma factor (sigma-70 family)
MAEPVSGAAISAVKWLTSLRLGYWTKRHNRLVEREYEDRSRWAQDDALAMQSALDALAEEMNANNLFYSGAHTSRQGQIRERFAVRWRDRKSRGDRLIEDLRDAENFLHRGWRWLARRPWPENLHEKDTERLTASWETIVQERTKHLLEGVERDLAALAPGSRLWGREAIADAIERLPEREKLVVTLYYYQDLTMAEIGEVLAVSEAHASQLHTTAILRLEQSLEDSAAG